MAEVQFDYQTYARRFLLVVSVSWLVCLGAVAVGTRGLPVPVPVLVVTLVLVSAATMLGLSRVSPWLAHAAMVLIFAVGFCLLMNGVDSISAVVVAYSVGFGLVAVAVTALLGVALTATR